MSTHCTDSLSSLLTTLKRLNTPEQLTLTISHGILCWQDPAGTPCRAPSTGQLGAASALLATAFHEQHHQIGWHQFFLGRISLYWSRAFASLSAVNDYARVSSWTAGLVQALWSFTRSMWKCRNEVIHGATAEEQVTRHLNTMPEEVTSHYTAFLADPSILFPRYHSLFHCTLAQSLRTTTHNAGSGQSLKDCFSPSNLLKILVACLVPLPL